MTATQTPAGLVITFAAPPDTGAGKPGPGECLADQPLDPAIPTAFFVPPVANANLLAQAAKGGTFQLIGIPKGDGYRVTALEGIQVVDSGPLSPGPAAEGGGDAGEPATGGDGGGMGGGGMAAESGDCPAGTATVVTPPGLDFLNVRQTPDMQGKILSQLPNGSEVTIVGACLQPAAGFAKKQTLKPMDGGAPAAGTPAPGAAWCRIEAPKQGCVSAEFLAFEEGGALKPAAGFAKSKKKKH